MEYPDFELVKTIPFKSKYVCDKFRQYGIFGRMYYIPKPHKFDLWHFDLFEYDDTLYMVASEEMGCNVCIAKSADWEHFEIERTPLLNTYSNRNKGHYFQYFYKPTAIVQNDSLHLFYTAQSPHYNENNLLFHTVIPFNPK